MGFIPRITDQNTVQLQAGYSPNSANFNDWVRYARASMTNGQTPSPAGYHQYLGPQPTARQSAAPGYNVSMIQEMPTQTSPPPMTPRPQPKVPKNIQYAAALSRMK